MSEAALSETGEDSIALGGLACSVGFLLRIAQLAAFDAFFRRFGRHNLRPGEFSVLWVIGLNPGKRQGDIARVLRIKPAHMTKLIQGLFESGLVSREVPDGDRRAVCLTLTERGAAFVDRAKDEFLNFDGMDTPRLQPSETAQLARLLQKFVGMPEGQGTTPAAPDLSDGFSDGERPPILDGNQAGRMARRGREAQGG